MNEAPNNQTGGMNETFSSQPSQTNPFTADLKGEFTSNFGTNTNAVSQIFKEGGFAGQNPRQKYLIIGGVVVVVLAIIFFFIPTGDDEGTEEMADGAADEATTEDGEDTETADGKDDEGKADEAKTDEATEETAEETTETPATDAAAPETTGTAVAESAPVSSGSYSGGGAASGGPVTLTEPADGSSLSYDETQGPAVFSWSGGGGHIVFSRNQSMNPTTMKIRVSGNSYSFNHPWPGTWYWKIENSSGGTEVRSFTVSNPPRRNVQLTQPASGGAVAGTGGTVTWQGDAKVAYYRVELSNGSWANPQFKFSSSGNSLTLNGVAPGSYQMRVGAFSEVSGRWEYSATAPVTVQ